MLLDEVREHARRKHEEMDADPHVSEASRRYGECVDKMLSNADILLASPKSLVIECLFFVGYDFDELCDVYDKLIEELSATYKVFDPNVLRYN